MCVSMLGLEQVDPYARWALYHEAISLTPSFFICLFVLVLFLKNPYPQLELKF